MRSSAPPGTSAVEPTPSWCSTRRRLSRSSDARCRFSRSTAARRVITPDERGHQRSSEVIRGHQWSSKVIRGHQRSSEVIRELHTLPVDIGARTAAARTLKGEFPTRRLELLLHTRELGAQPSPRVQMTLPMSFRGRIGAGEGEVRSGRRSEVRRACRTEATPCVAVGAPPWPPPAPPAWPPPDRSSRIRASRDAISSRSATSDREATRSLRRRSASANLALTSWRALTAAGPGWVRGAGASPPSGETAACSPAVRRASPRAP